MLTSEPVENFKKFPSPVRNVRFSDKRCFVQCVEELLEVSIVSPHILRFRYAPDGCFGRDFSYALTPGLSTNSGHFEQSESEDEIVIRTSELICRINKQTLAITLLTVQEEVILQDDAGFHYEPHQSLNGQYVYCSKKIQEGEYFFGLGDKPCDLNLRNKRLQNWNSDKYGYEKDTDPIYRDVPFYMGLHHGMAYGIFFDNTFKKFFDFGAENSSVTSFWADGGEMNYYFIYGPELLKVAERYTSLTGTAPLPPMWALGYHQSKWSYFPESKVMDIAQEFRARQLPCDAIHIDIDYMDGFRCFTWDKSRFPDPANMIRKLHEKGFKAIPIIDPGIKIDHEYPVFQEGLRHNYFCRRSEGELMKGAVWPGMCCFPDYTHPKVREWWGQLFRDMAEIGVQGIWNDMNEPTVFELVSFYDDVRHDYDGDNCSHRKAHNVYGMQMARASFEGMRHWLHGKRPFNLTRSGYAGVQRYSAVWTGDNIANWEHLWLANIQTQRLSISGISFAGSDVGGFIGEPNGPLLARWIQLGIFHPLLRSHSSGDRGDKEPWVFGEEIESIVRRYLELRYRLLPYLYTTFWQHTTTGTPIVRPLSFLDQANPETHYRMDEFGFGDSLLVCPVTAPDAKGRYMYLPGGNWYNYWTGAVYKGNKEIWTEAPLDTLPLFVKAGSVVPHYPVQQFVGEKVIEELTLHVYYGTSETTSVLYEDAGDGVSGEAFNEIRFRLKADKKELVLSRTVAHQGYSASYKHYKVIVYGLPFRKLHLSADQGQAQQMLLQKKEPLVFECPSQFNEIRITAL